MNGNTGNNLGKSTGGMNKANNQKTKTNNPLGNGYGALNGFKRNNGLGTNPNNNSANSKQGSVGNSIENAKQKAKKKAAKQALTTTAKAYNPALGKVVEKGLETKKGEEYLNEFAKAPTATQGMINVTRKFKRDQQKMRLILGLISYLAPMLIIMIILMLLFKQADTQKYSREDDGDVELEDGTTELANIFLNYPGLYENVQDHVNFVSEDVGVDIDKYLVLATLIAPIENGTIMPIEGDCTGRNGEEGWCYKFQGKLYDWEDFLKVWGNQSEILARMQVLTYINTNSSKYTDACKYSDKNMETYAKNDRTPKKVSCWNPLNWFKCLFTDAEEEWKIQADAEINAKCNDLAVGLSTIPDVRVLSIDEGYYEARIEDKGDEYEATFENKESDTGGVYFWNMVNEGGFVHKYFQDYLGYDEDKSEHENYLRNQFKILDITKYIYDYYYSIRRDCNDFQVIQGGLDQITYREVDGVETTMDFEEMFVPGAITATFKGCGNIDICKAQAILSRSYAYAAIVQDGETYINSKSEIGCHWHTYNETYNPAYVGHPEDDPGYDPDWPTKQGGSLALIKQAVDETRGIVVTPFTLDYKNILVRRTQYDAFCPQFKEPVDGMYYLPDGQRDLPIDDSKFNAPEGFKECPCFANEGARPGGGSVWKTSPLVAPTDPGHDRWGRTEDTLQKCWEASGETRERRVGQDTITEYEWEYSPTGGHGQDVSQHGMAYFVRQGDYKYDAVIKLFLERDHDYITYKKLEDTIEPGMCDYYLAINAPKRKKISY